MYTPSTNILKKYAKVMVQYALNGGKGINPGERVWISASETSKPLFTQIYNAVLEAGGHPTPHFLPEGFDRYFLNRDLVELGNEGQLKFFNTPYWEGIVKGHDHLLFIITPDVGALEGLDSKKVSMVNARMKPFMDMRKIKQRTNDLFWTLCLYPTESAAVEAGMTLEEYWGETIKACYLNEEDPVAKWKSIQAKIEEAKDKLNALKIKKVHIKGENIDLYISIGDMRQWLGGSGHNIPSFEIFISPDWRGTEGTIAFNQPLYHDGKRISGIKLEFKAGRIVKATAAENEDALLEMISHKNANAVGEFSFTPAGFSPISRPMAHTLFDENMGGKFGNTHIALGNAYEDSYSGDLSTVTQEVLDALGFNDSSVHTDIISTEDRVVTAYLEDGSMKIIYQNGQFSLD